MSSPLRFKVYTRHIDSNGKKFERLDASTRYAEEAAAIVAMNSYAEAGLRPVIKADGIIVWREGEDGLAADSYDTVAEVAWSRITRRSDAREAKHRAYLDKVLARIKAENERLAAEDAAFEAAKAQAIADGTYVGEFPTAADFAIRDRDRFGDREVLFTKGVSQG